MSKKRERLSRKSSEISLRERSALTMRRSKFSAIASMVTKACKTFRAIQLTAEAGLGQDASVLARQLFETAVAVKFILQKDSEDRASMYAAYENVRHLVMVEEAVDVKAFVITDPDDTLNKARTNVEAWEKYLSPQVLKSLRKHWSGRNLAWAAREVDMAHAYALMYRSTSAFAHGADANQHFFVTAAGGPPTLKLAPSGEQLKPVLESAINLMGVIIEAANDAFGLGEEAVIERIRAEATPTENGGAK
jgi:hypothetical protein